MGQDGLCGICVVFCTSFISEWPENQILIPDWTYFHCSGATLVKVGKDV
jgi:hypothetical protein